MSTFFSSSGCQALNQNVRLPSKTFNPGARIPCKAWKGNLA